MPGLVPGIQFPVRQTEPLTPSHDDRQVLSQNLILTNA